MKVYARHNNPLFGGLLSMMMVTVISGAAVLVVLPFARKIAAKLTAVPYARGVST